MGKKMYVPDMVCNKCADRIIKALNEIKITADIDLLSKTVDIKDEMQYQTAFNEVYELGFSPEGITE